MKKKRLEVVKKAYTKEDRIRLSKAYHKAGLAIRDLSKALNELPSIN